MPVRRFWLMAGNVSRLMAEGDLRALTVASAVNSSESAKTAREELTLQMGTVARVEHELDPDGWEMLKSMS